MNLNVNIYSNDKKKTVKLIGEIKCVKHGTITYTNKIAHPLHITVMVNLMT